MIIIFSSQGDFSTSIVLEWLNTLNKKWLRIDGDNYSVKFISYEKNNLIISKNGRRINLLNIVDSCWYRRKGLTNNLLLSKNNNEFNVFGNESNYQREHLKTELNVLIEFMYAIVENKATFNLGSSANATLNKLIVLESAEKWGLKIPQYKIFTSKKSLIKHLKDSTEHFVTKAISDGVYYFSEKFGFYTYTERVDIKRAKEFPETFFPSLLQIEIKKKYELRVFYLVGKFYSMAIFSQSNKKTKIDFRRNFGDNLVRTVPYKLPVEIESKLKNIFDELNLNTGSADLIVDIDNNYIFLEINPVGQFTMTSNPCNYYLEKKIAELL